MPMCRYAFMFTSYDVPYDAHDFVCLLRSDGIKELQELVIIKMQSRHSALLVTQTQSLTRLPRTHLEFWGASNSVKEDKLHHDALSRSESGQSRGPCCAPSNHALLRPTAQSRAP